MFKLIMQKRGLSTIIVTLILILVSIVAVGVIWVVVRNVIQTGTEGVGLSQFSLSAKILDVSIDNSSNNVSLTLKRNAGKGELEGIRFVFSSGENNEVITRNVSLKELEQMKFYFHLINVSVSDLISVSIVPLIKQDEKQISGIALDKYNFGNSKNYILSKTCSPTNCSALGYICGTWNNGTCAGTLNCGNCTGGQTCNASGRCVASCIPANCTSLGYQCGSGYANGSCSGNLFCGNCTGGFSCNASGKCVSSGDYIYALSCSQTDVQFAIDNASNGDTVLVPAGNCIWSTPVTCNKGITIQGAGIDNTTIIDGTTGAWMDEPFWITPKAGYTTIVKGFTFDGQNSVASSSGMVVIYGTYNNGNFRIHHNKFKNIRIRGVGVFECYGLIDHNTFLAPYAGATAQGCSIYGTRTNTNLGDAAWLRGLTLGTANAVYMEDNTFDYVSMNDGGMDAYAGARLVFRHNTVSNTPIGWHGCDSGNLRSTHTFEIYDNNFTTTVTCGGFALYSRGGTGVIYNNTWTGAYYVGILLASYRSCASYGVWGKCDGSNAIDGNDDTTGYHCQDQNGWTSTGTDDGTGPNQILSPVYAWANTHDGAAFNVTLKNNCAEEAIHMQENRDFYNGIVKPGYVPYTYPHPLTLVP